MIFSELYSAYYNAVSSILKAVIEKPIKKDELRAIIMENAFSESILNIEPKFNEEKWQLISSYGTTPIKNVPTMPLTTLEKQWLKAIFMDKRIKLFTDEILDIPDTTPLFTEEDYYIFDKYLDGDPYEDQKYIKNFRLILDSIEKKYPLSIDKTNRKGTITHVVVLPSHLEYSEKDDKFRLFGLGCRYGDVINLSTIVSCKPYNKPFEIDNLKEIREKESKVEFELIDRRNALERVLLHFAHFKKEVERIDNDKYKILLYYDKDDETEIVIRILSFGPMVKVTAPNHFVNLIKERLIAQKSCEL